MIEEKLPDEPKIEEPKQEEPKKEEPKKEGIETEWTKMLKEIHQMLLKKQEEIKVVEKIPIPPPIVNTEKPPEKKKKSFSDRIW